MAQLFFFFLGTKTANSELFKAFGNAEKMKKNKQDGGSYFIIIPNLTLIISPSNVIKLFTGGILNEQNHTFLHFFPEFWLFPPFPKKLSSYT